MLGSILSRSFSTSIKSMGKLSGKVAVVTASTDGIGYAIAKKLAEDGAHIVISSRKQSNVDTALEKLRANNLSVSGTACHVGKAEDRQKLLNFVKQEFGSLDILVSNAAVNPYFGPVLNTPEAAYDKIFDVNVKATFLLIKEFVPLMECRQNSSITVVSSIGGFTPFDLLGIYSLSKTALLGLTKVLTNELAAKNIRINSLCPGIVKTKFSGALWKSEDVANQILQSVPLKRFADADDCGGIVSFLSSDEAKYITGENIVVGGGMQSRL